MARELKWTEEPSYKRFACTQCNWSHPNPSLTDTPETLDKTVLKFVERAFTSHRCATPQDYPEARAS
jgi:hypothetical protein